MSAHGEIDAITIDRAGGLALARFWASVFGTEIGSAVGDGPAYVDLLPCRASRSCGSSG